MMSNSFKAYAADDHLLFLGHSLNVKTHKHQFLQLVITTKPENHLPLYINNEIIECRGVLLASETPHRFNPINQSYIIILIDPTSVLGRCLNQHYLADFAPYKILPDSLLKRFDLFIEQINHDFIDATMYKAIWLEILNHLGVELCQFSHGITEPRITNSLNVIQTKNQTSLKLLADSVYLSASRFSHLFKDTTGYSLKNYLLFQQILKGLKCIAVGYSVTEAALTAGFDTPSHFSSTCRKMIGINPNLISKVSVFLKVSDVC